MSEAIWRIDDVSFKRSDFFSRLCLSAFRDLPFVIDDYAILSIATASCIRNGTALYQAFTLASSLGELHKGALFIHENDELKACYSHLAAIEEEMLDKQRVTSEAALFLALRWLREQESLPAFLRNVEEVVFESVFDFSECELQILLRLAQLSLPLRFRLPIDLKERDLLVPVQDLLNQLESRCANLPITLEPCELKVSEKLASFFDAVFDANTQTPGQNVQVALPAHFDSQVDWVCDQIDKLRAIDHRSSIAVAFRSMDVRTRLFEEAFSRRGLPYRISAGLALFELPHAKAILARVKVAADDVLTLRTLSEHLQVFNEPTSLSPLLNYFAQSFRDEKELLPVHVFYHWLKQLFERRNASFSAGADADCIDVVSVKQLWSRKYDYVFIVDLAQGRFPKADSRYSAFTDSECFEINQQTSKRVFPLASVRQGLESLWFVGAIASATHGLYLSSSNTDPKGREQAPSEFLNAATRVTGIVVTEVSQAGLETSSTHRRSMLEHAEPFKLEPKLAKQVFKRWLGLQYEHPLTPTRLEAFASCPFRALVQRIFGIDQPQESNGDVDPRATGRFAHAVLEAFFRNYSGEWAGSHGLTSVGRAYLKEIIESKKSHLEMENTQTSRTVIRAQMMWLSLVIERAVSNLLKDPAFEKLRPAHLEYSLGFDDQHFEMMLGDEKLFLGGIVDRVDEGADEVAIIDYKMSSAISLRQKASEKEVFKTHFQLPLYSRLILSAHPQLRDKEISGYLISIRDGACIRVKGDFKDRVLDDTRDDSLKAAISDVMLPVLQGNFEAKENANCPTCYLKAVCRI